MIKFNYISIPVVDYGASKEWYASTLGLEVEIDMPAHKTVGVRDSSDFTLFLHEDSLPGNPSAFVLYFRVDDVHEFYQSRSAKGVRFNHEPKTVFWGFGAELADPNGYRIGIWDEHTMPKTRA